MAAGDPISGDLCSVTIDASTLPHRLSNDWTTFTFDTTYSIVSGTKYAIVVGTSGIGFGEYIQWGQDTSAGYANGLKCISDDSGSTWTQSPTRDCVFRTKAGSTIKDNFETTPAWQAIYDPYYIAQTFTAGSSYTITAVELRLRTGVIGGTTGDVIISIRNVEGEDYPPYKPINPTPSHEGSGVTLDGTGVIWEDGGGATSYDVYYGTLSGFLSLLEEGVTDLSYTLRDTNWPLYGEAYYWRIDAVNEYGTTTGDEWYFTTLIFSPPTTSGVTWSDPGNNTGYTGTPTGVNNMITVRRLVAAADDALWYESA